ncbi:MAG: phospho-N-acetylmuramoyl-pentapeptide-transferase [Sulfobacillus sp.]
MTSWLGGLLALALSLGGCAWWIRQPWTARQTVRVDGPISHQVKAGTPTMGGVVFVIAAVLAALASGAISGDGLAVLGLTLAMAGIGLADDWVKVHRRQPLGLRARGKVAAGLIVATAFALTLGSASRVIRVPLGGGIWHAPLWLFVIVVDLVVAATANGANLTDGVDGLAAGVSMPILIFFAIAALALNNGATATIAVALLGALIGFFVYNRHPARVMMGDTGAFGIGGAIAGLAVTTGWEILLPLVAAVFVAETLSVILQVISFRMTGRRIFRMSPLHHHFELGGWSEPRVLQRFWTAGVVAGILGTLLWGVRI